MSNGVNPTANRVNAYQQWTRQHWKKDDDVDQRILHAVLGLTGEAGEVADLIKKGFFTPSRLSSDFAFYEELTKELGDVMYYLCRIADEYDIDMYDVLQTNIDKLDKRHGTASE